MRNRCEHWGCGKWAKHYVQIMGGGFRAVFSWLCCTHASKFEDGCGGGH